jgi:GTP cyclohydrolase I
MTASLANTMRQPDLNKISEYYLGILKEIGADVDSEGMKETPLRAAKALVEMTEGSRMEVDQLTKMFKAECQTAICHDMGRNQRSRLVRAPFAADSHEHHYRLYSR